MAGGGRRWWQDIVQHKRHSTGGTAQAAPHKRVPCVPMCGVQGGGPRGGQPLGMTCEHRRQVRPQTLLLGSPLRRPAQERLGWRPHTSNGRA